jgi:hypothetical protein
MGPGDISNFLFSVLVGISKIAIWDKMSRTELDEKWYQQNGMGFKNTLDYCSWIAIMNGHYHSWMVITIDTL